MALRFRLEIHYYCCPSSRTFVKHKTLTPFIFSSFGIPLNRRNGGKGTMRHRMRPLSIETKGNKPLSGNPGGCIHSKTRISDPYCLSFSFCMWLLIGRKHSREKFQIGKRKKKDTHTRSCFFLPLPLHQEAATVCFLISEEILLFIWKKTSFPSLEGD